MLVTPDVGLPLEDWGLRVQRPVVVTGAAGFIGSHLVEKLLAAGCRVVGIDDFDPWYDPATKRQNLVAALDHPRFRLVEVDLAVRPDGLAGDPLPDLLAGAEVVFHLAGRPGVQDSWGSGFSDYVDRNISATQRLYEAALAARVDRVVYASSSSVYGSTSASGARRPSPISPYGVAKLAGEHLGEVYRNRGLAVTSLRYFTVYGPRQRPDMAIYRLFQAATSGGARFVLRGDGTQRREFTHVDDVVAATIAAGWRAEAVNSTVDVGGGSSTSLNEVISMIEWAVGGPVRLDRSSPVAGDPSLTEADHGAVNRVLGWQPTIELEQGLRSQWHWHRQSATNSRGSLTPAGSVAVP